MNSYHRKYIPQIFTSNVQSTLKRNFRLSKVLLLQTSMTFVNYTATTFKFNGSYYEFQKLYLLNISTLNIRKHASIWILILGDVIDKLLIISNR